MPLRIDRPVPNNANFDFDVDITLYKGRYPGKLDLNPNSEVHQNLLQYVNMALVESYDIMQARFPSWQEIDRKLTAYIDLTKAKFDKEKTDAVLAQEDPLKPVSIVVPQSYATKEILITYMMAAFLESPIFRYASAGDPNDTLGNIVLESIIDQQVQRMRVALNLVTMWSDDATYGYGATSPYWTKILGRKTRRGITEEVVKYEGNGLMNLDPYNSFPDPNVPITQVEKMAYFLWVDRTTYYDLLSLEAQDESFFNVRYLDGKIPGHSVYFSATPTESGRFDKTALDNQNAVNMAKPVDVTWAYIRLIPEQFGLGAEDYPQLWKIAVAADRLIISASPSDTDMEEIPVCTISTKCDGHTTVPPSALEIEYPLQSAIDWLWNSHVANVRKSVNNMLAVDPSLININDVLDTSAGMVARLRAAAWGRGQMKDAIMPIPIQDITQNNIMDIGFLKRMDEEFMGIAPQMKGIQERKGERVSSAEAKTTHRSALSRREKDAKIAALQGHYKIAQWFASNTLQFLSGEGYVKIVGKYEEVLRREYGRAVDTQNMTARVLFDDLDVDYDVVIQDGTVPGGEDVDTWINLIQLATADPATFQQLDFIRIWKHVARLLGAKNTEDFIKKAPAVRSAPMREIEEGVQSGNLAPLGEVA